MDSAIETVVFDLDGTIYQDTGFYRHYLRFLVEGTPRAQWGGDLTSFCGRVFRGEALKMNSFYRTAQGDFSSPGGFFNALGALRLDAWEPGAYNLGDAWAVVEYIGASLGLLGGGRREAVYARTRAAMVADGLRADAALRASIRALTGRCATVLVSNSYESTAREFLRAIGFDDVFSRAVFSARKPDGLAAALDGALPGVLARPQTILSVGDFAYNDLEPLAALGARTVWINPYEGVAKPPCDVELKTTADLARFLDSLC
ncbi:MAG: HAD family hydrolase [Oscillospiraceae bacterium]|nr:HAD family hydrolase [Oscillospiraceae bacterium]